MGTKAEMHWPSPQHILLEAFVQMIPKWDYLKLLRLPHVVCVCMMYCVQVIYQMEILLCLCAVYGSSWGLPVPINWTILTQHPSHSRMRGMSFLYIVKLKGSWHRGSSQELHSKQSIVEPAAEKKNTQSINLQQHSLVENTVDDRFLFRNSCWTMQVVQVPIYVQF